MVRRSKALQQRKLVRDKGLGALFKLCGFERVFEVFVWLMDDEIACLDNLNGYSPKSKVKCGAV